MAQSQPKSNVQTIAITNFGGRLTRILNGDLNSGFAKFTTSYGYDPFSKPMNLTWMENPTLLYQTGVSSPLKDLIMTGKTRYLGETNPVLYAVGSQGSLYKIQINSNTSANVGSIVGVASVKAGGATYQYGASMDFYGSTEKIYVGSDSQLNAVNFDGSADAVIGNASNYAPNLFRPLKQFAGKLLFGNGPTIGAVSATGTVTSSVIGVSSAVGNIYSELNPALGVETRIRDIDVSPDNTYALLTGSSSDNEPISTHADAARTNTVPSEGALFYWNGSDQTVTSALNLPSNFVSALQTYLQRNMFFSADTFGAALNDGTNKILTLINNKPPFPNATGVNGNFLFWVAPERSSYNEGDPTQVLFASFYYFGSLDQENPPGLYRLFKLPPDNAPFGGNFVQTPFNSLVSLAYSDTNSGNSSVYSAGTGQHYFSTFEANSDPSIGSIFSLRKFNVPPSGSGASQIGVYETQTQLFSKRVGISQVRVYTEPTAVNNSFRLYVIGSDGNIISDATTGINGFSYTYVAGSNSTRLQGPLERINFNPNMKTFYGFGIRIVNFGSKNMTIKKIEVDYSEEGK